MSLAIPFDQAEFYPYTAAGVIALNTHTERRMELLTTWLKTRGFEVSNCYEHYNLPPLGPWTYLASPFPVYVVCKDITQLQNLLTLLQSQMDDQYLP